MIVGYYNNIVSILAETPFKVSTKTDSPERRTYFPTMAVDVAFYINANCTRTFIQNGKLGFMVEQSGHLQYKNRCWSMTLKKTYTNTNIYIKSFSFLNNSQCTGYSQWQQWSEIRKLLLSRLPISQNVICSQECSKYKCWYCKGNIRPSSVFLLHWEHPSSPERYPRLLHGPGCYPTGHRLNTPLTPANQTVDKKQVNLFANILVSWRLYVYLISSPPKCV